MVSQWPEPPADPPRCPKCGYDRSAIPPDTCPECGTHEPAARQRIRRAAPLAVILAWAGSCLTWANGFIPALEHGYRFGTFVEDKVALVVSAAGLAAPIYLTFLMIRRRRTL